MNFCSRLSNFSLSEPAFLSRIIWQDKLGFHLWLLLKNELFFPASSFSSFTSPLVWPFVERWCENFLTLFTQNMPSNKKSFEIWWEQWKAELFFWKQNFSCSINFREGELSRSSYIHGSLICLDFWWIEKFSIVNWGLRWVWPFFVFRALGKTRA